MFKEHNITPSDFNVVCAPIQTFRTKKSDGENGYYIVDGLWGSCFHRIATKREAFEVVGNCNPTCQHTYTLIPSKLAENTYFVYVNFKGGYIVRLPNGATVVGIDEAQPHKSGGWFSQSMLIYCPDGYAPVVEPHAETCPPKRVRFVTQKGVEFFLSLGTLMLGRPHRYINTNEEGYYTSTRPTKTEEEQQQPTLDTLSIGEIVQQFTRAPRR